MQFAFNLSIGVTDTLDTELFGDMHEFIYTDAWLDAVLIKWLIKR
jgi:hypothetical protein